MTEGAGQLRQHRASIEEADSVFADPRCLTIPDPALGAGGAAKPARKAPGRKRATAT
jgi:hypothetical protein